MARRNKPNAFAALVERVARVPWWVGVGLAVLSYFLLNAAAKQTVVADATPGHITSTIAHSAWKSLATIGQYLVPLACLAGAGASAWRRKERRDLLAQATHNPASHALDGMSWREFELLVGEGFRQQGYTVVETGGGGADGGVDLVLSRPGRNGSEKFLVQCKQWRALNVGVDVVRELYGVMAARGAAGGFVVTSGRFTEEATRFASGRNVRLLDGDKLIRLIQQAQMPPRAAPSQPADTSVRQRTAPPSQWTIACPLCTKPMVRRVAKRGSNAGREFWGCTGYPDCRGTRPLA